MNDKTPVLQHGYVLYVDHMGDDNAVVDAARTSYGEGTIRKSTDATLLRKLMRDWHSGPFEMTALKIEVQCPIFVARQWMRHRTQSFNEYSLRYSEPIDAIHVTEPDEWRAQSKTNRQGSGDGIPFEVGEELTERVEDLNRLSDDVYWTLLANGVAREQARDVLPVSQYTRFVACADLRNWLAFLRLRLDTHAQAEIRAFAEVVGQIVERLFPRTWQAFIDYQLESITFSRMELAGLGHVLRQIMSDDDITTAVSASGLAGREAREFTAKLRGLVDGG